MFLDDGPADREPLLNVLLKGKDPDNKKFAPGQWTAEMDKAFLATHSYWSVSGA